MMMSERNVGRGVLRTVMGVRYLRTLLAFAIVVALAVPLMGRFVLRPHISQFFLDSVEREAIRTANHLARMMVVPHDKGRSRMTAAMDAHAIVESFDLWKLKLFSPDGITLYSTDVADVGAGIGKPEVLKALTAGQPYTLLVSKETPTVEGELAAVDVIEVYVPIIRDGTLVGAFEIYYDVTEQRDALDAVLHKNMVILGTFSAVSFVVMITLIIRVAWGTRAKVEAEDALAKSERWLRLVLDSTHEGIVVFDTEGRCVLSNRAAATLLGHDASEALQGRDIVALFKPTDDDGTPLTRDDLPLFAEPGSSSPQIDRSIRLTRSNGDTFSADLSAGAVVEGDRVMGSVIVFSDATERHLADDELRRSRTLQAMGSLAGGIAHELNNLLLPVLALSTLIRDKTEEDSTRRRAEKIVAASERAKIVVEQIVEFSRGDADVSERSIASDAVDQALALLSRTVPATATLEHDIGANGAVVPLAEDKLRTILFNLVSNAVDGLTGLIGTITIRLEAATLDQTIPGPLTVKPGRYVRLSVADTGIGMDDATAARAFEPFFTTKPVGQGTGLGLSIVHGIVSSADGGIAVRSQPDNGTTIDIYLPIMED